MKHKNLNDLQRAAWFARLAFGVSTDLNSIPKAPEKSQAVFHVIP